MCVVSWSTLTGPGCGLQLWVITDRCADYLRESKCDKLSVLEDDKSFNKWCPRCSERRVRQLGQPERREDYAHVLDKWHRDMAKTNLERLQKGTQSPSKIFDDQPLGWWGDL